MSWTSEKRVGGESKASDCLLSWLESHGGSVAKLRLATLDGEMGLSVFTTDNVVKREMVMSVPISLCMTVESVSMCNPGIVSRWIRAAVAFSRLSIVPVPHCKRTNHNI